MAFIRYSVYRDCVPCKQFFHQFAVFPDRDDERHLHPGQKPPHRSDVCSLQNVKTVGLISKKIPRCCSPPLMGEVSGERFDHTQPGLLALNGWILEQDCEQVAVESTGVYWYSVYSTLENSVDGDRCQSIPGKKHPGKKDRHHRRPVERRTCPQRLDQTVPDLPEG